ncbi:hypothetical protein [Helicobacter felis]|uniref:hypothetical protein n=1 Tax=Helicobacter felis TaxID=214 RepID=UPI000CF035C0|nr:hypothetical protein [Helicobacter felis]
MGFVRLVKHYTQGSPRLRAVLRSLYYSVFGNKSRDEIAPIKISHPQKSRVFKRIEGLSNEKFIATNREIAAGGGGVGNPFGDKPTQQGFFECVEESKEPYPFTILTLPTVPYL